MKRETAIEQNEPSITQEQSSSVFSARCRGCHEEAIYALSQIVDFPEEDLGRLSV